MHNAPSPPNLSQILNFHLGDRTGVDRRTTATLPRRKNGARGRRRSWAGPADLGFPPFQTTPPGTHPLWIKWQRADFSWNRRKRGSRWEGDLTSDVARRWSSMLQPPPEWLRAPARTTHERRLPRVLSPRQIQGRRRRFQSPPQGREQLRPRQLRHRRPHELVGHSLQVAAREEGRRDGRAQRKHSRHPFCLTGRHGGNHETFFLLSGAKAMTY